VNYDAAIAPNESATISSMIIDIGFIRSCEKENLSAPENLRRKKIFNPIRSRAAKRDLPRLVKPDKTGHSRGETSAVCVTRYRGNLISSDNLSFVYRLHLSAFISTRIARFQKCTRALTR